MTSAHRNLLGVPQREDGAGEEVELHLGFGARAAEVATRRGVRAQRV